MVTPYSESAYAPFSISPSGIPVRICHKIRIPYLCIIRHIPLLCPCGGIWDTPAMEAESCRDRRRYFLSPCSRSRHDHNALLHSHSRLGRVSLPHSHSRHVSLLHIRSILPVCPCLSRRNHFSWNPYRCSILSRTSLSSLHGSNRAAPSCSSCCGWNYSCSCFPVCSNSKALIKENSS